MSLLLRAAAAAARRTPSAARTTPTTMLGRRTMASSSSSARTETMEGRWMVTLACCWGGWKLVNWGQDEKMHRIAVQPNVEEINSTREEMKTLQDSNDQLLALLERLVLRTQE